MVLYWGSVLVSYFRHSVVAKSAMVREALCCWTVWTFLAIRVALALDPWPLVKGPHGGEGQMDGSEAYSPDKIVNKNNTGTSLVAQ